ncbi:MAG: carboxymuconolactone decarboxylase family protein [Candidatus Hydrogenedentes bacterium]|nr:carboxymuconolactone decarboxylase family protein [Candidatus Hydrogenedentota bacterium]
MIVTPIERPNGIRLRIAWLYSRAYFGKVILPMKLVYARVPAALTMVTKMHTLLHRGLSLDARLVLLVQMRVAAENGCAFCMDIGRALAVRLKIADDTLNAVAQGAPHASLSPREALAVGLATRVARKQPLSTEDWAPLKAAFTEKEIVELTLVMAIEAFFNTITHTLEIPPDGLCILAKGRSKQARPAAPELHS